MFNEGDVCSLKQAEYLKWYRDTYPGAAYMLTGKVIVVEAPQGSEAVLVASTDGGAGGFVPQRFLIKEQQTETE